MITNSTAQPCLASFSTVPAADYSLSPGYETFYYESNGAKVQGWILKPVGFDPQKKVQWGLLFIQGNVLMSLCLCGFVHNSTLWLS